MGTQVATERFNSLPSFEAALSDERHTKNHLLKIGQLLVNAGLEHRIGISLLHRHFALRSGEFLVRANYRHASFVHVTKRLPIDGRPISWWHNAASGEFDALEYSEAFCDAEDGQSPEALFHEIGISNYLLGEELSNVFGFVDLEALPIFGLHPAYEISHDALRLSMLSHWRDPSHQAIPFAQSTWRFSRDGSGVALISVTRCSNCPSCRLAPLPQEPEWVEDLNVFGLGVRHRFLEMSVESTDHSLLKRLQDMVGLNVSANSEND